jgi:ATP-dependent Clp protease ATP-binding subunit ClpA
MTTNAGAREMANADIGFRTAVEGAPGGNGQSKSMGKAKSAIERTFSPEFRNRLDAWIQFNPLEMVHVERVVDKFVDELREQLVDKHVTLELTETARQWLARQGFDSLYGARPMARLIQQKIREPLAEAILFGELQGGGEAVAEIRDDDVVLTFSAAEVA